MKNRFLNAMLCMAALLLACVWSCAKDDAQVNLETSDETQIILSKKLSLLDISHFNEVNTAISRLSTRLNRKGSRLQKTLDTDSIFIDVEDIIYMTYAQTHTYTFKMIRSNPEYYIENIVLHYNVDTQSYDEYLLQYDLTAEEYIDIANGGDLSDDVITYITNLDTGTLSAALNKNSCTITCQTLVLTCTAGGGHYPNDPECCVTKGECSADKGGAIFNTCTPSCTYDPPVESIDEGDNSSGGGGGGNGTIATNPNPREVCHQNGSIGISGNESECHLPVYDDYQIINELNGKALCVYNKLKSSSNGFKNSIKKFDGEFPVAHIKFDLGNLGIAFGKTIPPNSTEIDTSPDYVITVRLNNNSSINGVTKRPNLLVAKTIAHEVMHAEMFRKVLSFIDNGGNVDGVTRQDVLDALDGNYPGLYDYYRRYKNWQHAQMATHYRETLARILQEYDTGIAVADNQQPQLLYMDLAWEGLIYPEIPTWNNLPQTEKNRVNNVISDYIADNQNETCTE